MPNTPYENRVHIYLTGRIFWAPVLCWYTHTGVPDFAEVYKLISWWTETAQKCHYWLSFNSSSCQITSTLLKISHDTYKYTEGAHYMWFVIHMKIYLFINMVLLYSLSFYASICKTERWPQVTLKIWLCFQSFNYSDVMFWQIYFFFILFSSPFSSFACLCSSSFVYVLKAVKPVCNLFAYTKFSGYKHL